MSLVEPSKMENPLIKPYALIGTSPLLNPDKLKPLKTSALLQYNSVNFVQSVNNLPVLLTHDYPNFDISSKICTSLKRTPPVIFTVNSPEFIS